MSDEMTLTQEIKNKYIERALMHQAADDFEKGHYWDGKKGCAVGCLAHDNDNPHETLANDLDSPEWVFHCTERIFEGLPLEEGKQWPVDFIKAIPVGLSSEQWDRQIKAPFIVMVLESVLNTFNHDKFPDVKPAIDGSITLWKRNDIGSQEFAKAADVAADAAADAAVDAAARAAYAAVDAAYAAVDAADAVDAARAAYAAAYAARAARAAARAAYAAYAAYAAAYAADAAYKHFAYELLNLMRKAQP